MSKVIIIVLFILSLSMPVSALEIEAPRVPISGADLIPDHTASFGEGLWELFQNGTKHLRPDITEAMRVCLGVFICVLAVSVVCVFSDQVKGIAELIGTAAIASMLLQSTNSMLQLGTEVIREISEYGKLLYPVMATALAAQGGISSSGTLYIGTAVFDTILSSILSNILLPLIYAFLALSIANSATGEDTLKNIASLLKNSMSWCLKILLTIFTTYMSITGVVSGTTDAAALKATKVTISTVVPVVGGILSDSSEAILVSAGMMKNAAGVYGIFAVLAVFLMPFLRIGCHYLLLKLTAALCGIFGGKTITGLLDAFSGAMGLLLAMTSAVCLMLLISTVCFMKGVG